MDVYWHSQNVLYMMQIEHLTGDRGDQPEEDNTTETSGRGVAAAMISNLRRKLNSVSMDHTLIMSPAGYKLSHFGNDDIDAVLQLSTETLLGQEGELQELQNWDM
jgi:hypothetical protein